MKRSLSSNSRLRRISHRRTTRRADTAPIVYYVSAHGYGHSVRSCDVIRALRKLYPEIPIVIRSETPAAFFESRLKGIDYSLAPAAFDVGLVQMDSLRADLNASLERAQELIAQRDELVATESKWLRQLGAGLIVADIPAIPIAAAKRAGLPAVAVANFSWDWIYAEFIARDQRWQQVVESFRADYSKADLLFRLPFSGPMEAFPNRLDVGLLTKPGHNRRSELANATGADPEKRWILICFWSLEWSPKALESIANMQDYEFFAMPETELGPTNTHSVAQGDFAFSDIVASVDAVLSKPGYGIVSDCIANDKPLAYAERTDFREYAVLVENIRKYLRRACIGMADLYAGDLQPALDSLWTQNPPRERIGTGGDEKIAQEIQAMASR